MALAQEEIPELIDTADTHHEQELIERYRLKTSSFLEQAKSKYSRKIYSPLKEQYKEHSDIFIEKITDNEFLFDARIDSFLHKTYHQLTSSKHYHTDVELLVSKHRTLNAFMSPDDFLVLHIGSFYYTDNEGQLVSIMAHELAHCLLEHAEQS